MTFQQELRANLSAPLDIRVFDSLPSTNTFLKTWARDGASHGALVLAHAQSAGRGRFTRFFFSPVGGLYLSLYIKKESIKPGQLITLAAVSVLQALKALTGQTLSIKWVNDVLLDNKKAGGILSEGILQGNKLAGAVVGIGLNTHDVPFPPDLIHQATHIKGFHEPAARAKLAAAIVNTILAGIEQMPAHLADYRLNCVTLNKEVSFELNGAIKTGLAFDVDEEGALLVQTPEGPLRLLSGDVSLKKD